MRTTSALQDALLLSGTPSLARQKSRAPLPPGVTEVLELAAGDKSAVDKACLATGRSENAIRMAAGFFVEQILFSRDADSYRVLGTNSDAKANELRRHMALLLKWLHPDVAIKGSDGLDRSVFANRVTNAWENVKTPARRAAYDRSITRNNHANPQESMRPTRTATSRYRTKSHSIGAPDRLAAQQTGTHTASHTLMHRFFKMVRSRE